MFWGIALGHMGQSALDTYDKITKDQLQSLQEKQQATDFKNRQAADKQLAALPEVGTQMNSKSPLVSNGSAPTPPQGANATMKPTAPQGAIPPQAAAVNAAANALAPVNVTASKMAVPTATNTDSLAPIAAAGSTIPMGALPSVGSSNLPPPVSSVGSQGSTPPATPPNAIPVNDSQPGNAPSPDLGVPGSNMLQVNQPNPQLYTQGQLDRQREEIMLNSNYMPYMQTAMAMRHNRLQSEQIAQQVASGKMDLAQKQYNFQLQNIYRVGQTNKPLALSMLQQLTTHSFGQAAGGAGIQNMSYDPTSGMVYRTYKLKDGSLAQDKPVPFDELLAKASMGPGDWMKFQDQHQLHQAQASYMGAQSKYIDAKVNKMHIEEPINLQQMQANVQKTFSDIGQQRAYTNFLSGKVNIQNQAAALNQQLNTPNLPREQQIAIQQKIKALNNQFDQMHINSDSYGHVFQVDPTVPTQRYKIWDPDVKMFIPLGMQASVNSSFVRSGAVKIIKDPRSGLIGYSVPAMGVTKDAQGKPQYPFFTNFNEAAQAYQQATNTNQPPNALGPGGALGAMATAPGP